MPECIDQDHHEHEDNGCDDKSYKHVNARLGVVDGVACAPFGASFLIGEGVSMDVQKLEMMGMKEGW